MDKSRGCKNVQLFSFSKSFFRPERNCKTSASSSSRLAGLGMPMATVSSREASMFLIFSRFQRRKRSLIEILVRRRQGCKIARLYVAQAVCISGNIGWFQERFHFVSFGVR